MNFTKKTVRYALTALIIIFSIAISTSQEAKALKIRVSTVEGTGFHVGTIGDGCGGRDAICMTVELSRTSQAGSEGTAELKGRELTVMFNPKEYLLTLKKDQLKVQVEKAIDLDAEFCKALGVTEAQVQPGTYKIKLDDGKAIVVFKMKAKEKANR